MAALQPIIDWITINPTLSGIAIFAIAFSESIAGIGLIVPGLALMGSIGWLISTGVLPAFASCAWAAAGAFVGDSLSFWLGNHYQDKVRRFWPFSRYPHWLKHGEAFFHKHGGKSVALGRFCGPTRTMVPMIAGMMNMHVKRFIITDFFSAIAWAPLYMLPGFLVGLSLGHLDARSLSHLTLWVVAGSVASWFAYKAIKIGFNKGAQTMQRYYQFEHYDTARFLLLSLIGLSLFATIAFDVIIHGQITSLNEPIFHFLQCLRAPHLDQWMYTISLAASHTSMAIILAALIGWLYWQKNTLQAYGALFLFFWAECLTLVSKISIGYIRPLPMVASGYAFPSGHTVRTTLLVCFISYLLAIGRNKEIRHTIIGVLITLISLEAFSRLYLGAHWLSDIIGAIALSLFTLALLALWQHRHPVKPVKAGQLIIVTLAALTLGTSISAWRHPFSENPLPPKPHCQAW